MSLSREFEAALKNHFLAMTALLDVELATVVSSPFESATKFLLFEYDSPMFSDEFAVSAWPMSEDGEPTAKGHWLLKGRAVVVPREIEDYPKYENINRWDLASKLLERWFVRRWKHVQREFGPYSAVIGHHDSFFKVDMNTGERTNWDQVLEAASRVRETKRKNASRKHAGVWATAYFSNGGAPFRADVLVGSPPTSAFDFKFSSGKRFIACC